MPDSSSARREDHGSARAGANGLASLPQPRHLYAWLTASHHYHLGLFERRNDRLSEALDRTALSALPFFSTGDRVLDVGCGLGGATTLLASRGMDVRGIDPCAACIDHARRSARPAHRGRFTTTTLEEVTANGRDPRPLHGVVMIEVLQHFPDVRGLLDLCGALLDGGTVVIVDVVATRTLEWERVPFHAGSSVISAARCGFRIHKHRDLTDAAFPTFDRLREEAADQRDGLVRTFAGRPSIREEVDELDVQLGHLRSAFEWGDLRYELVALRGRR